MSEVVLHHGWKLNGLNAVTPACVVAMRCIANRRALDELCQRNTFQEGKNLPAEVGPQLMS